MKQPYFDVTGAVAVINQTLDYAFPVMNIIGEVSELRISKGKWVYFDIKDDTAKLKCFASVYSMRMPIQDGMQVVVTAQARLHPLYGFSMNIQTVQPMGEGSIKKAADILKSKLDAEGLFSAERKRPVEIPPEKVGLITSSESAAYADFIKVMNERWQGVEITLFDVHVQGEQAVGDIVEAISHFNQHEENIDVLVLIRGGGSADDLAAFSTEPVVRAVAASRIPTFVAVGHETDISLAERAADVAASTPSNAAELLFPDKTEKIRFIQQQRKHISELLKNRISTEKQKLRVIQQQMEVALNRYIQIKQKDLSRARSFLQASHPAHNLKRGFSIIEKQGKIITSQTQLSINDDVTLRLSDGIIKARITDI